MGQGDTAQAVRSSGDFRLACERARGQYSLCPASTGVGHRTDCPWTIAAISTICGSSIVTELGGAIRRN